MILKELETQLATAVHPVAKALHKGEHFKVLAMGFKKGMVLKEHQAHSPSKLFVLKGKIIYHQNDVSTPLALFDEIEIPVNILHSVEALEDSLCLLTQG
ncbi:MAG: hypothetical protein ABIU63_02680 [Chitinophagaceae bacterium]